MQQVIVANDDQGCRRKQLADRNVLRFVRVRRHQCGSVVGNLDEINSSDAGHTCARKIKKLGQQSGQSVRLTLYELSQGPGIVVGAGNLCEQLRCASDRCQWVLDLMRQRRTQLGYRFETLSPGMKSLDFRFTKPEGGELGGHFFTTSVCLAE